MSIIELEVARGHLMTAGELYDRADDERANSACYLLIQMAMAEAQLVIAQSLVDLVSTLHDAKCPGDAIAVKLV